MDKLVTDPPPGSAPTVGWKVTRNGANELGRNTDSATGDGDAEPCVREMDAFAVLPVIVVADTLIVLAPDVSGTADAKKWPPSATATTPFTVSRTCFANCEWLAA